MSSDDSTPADATDPVTDARNIVTDATNIVLTGFMGTGKTTVGRRLAERLGFDFVDTDHLIEADHGPIPLIFAEQGEAAFRAIERATATTLADRTSTVVATGGRLMLDTANAEVLGASARVFCLTAPAEVIVERVLGDGSAERPLLATDDPRAQVEGLLAERAEGYARFEQVSTLNRDPDQIADDIIQRLRC